MSDRRDWWLQRADADVIDAYVHISDFETDAQVLIDSEFHRQGLDQLGPLPRFGHTSFLRVLLPLSV